MEKGDEELKDLEDQKYKFSLSEKVVEEKRKAKITLKGKKNLILFKAKGLGKFKFNFLERDILFALLGMPIHTKEIQEIIDQPKEIMEQNFIELMKYELVENIGTMKKKQLRGDSHLQVYWRLSEKGGEVALLLLDYFNELALQEGKRVYAPLTKEDQFKL